MKATIEQLANISIFADLKPEQIALLQPDSEIREYQSEEIIMQEGDRLPATLYAVAQGRLRVVKTATTGKETILRTLNIGEIFAAPALFGDSIAPAMVI
ncbi:MAG: cyclic nucleotide-binding domain-containing protein, partial [Cyanobacteria bacterium CAN_BIN43]|nr:cyclic nucleotide-binding domain-containing protein [Cyanobacteria bacterium CAN_BIN43]MCY7283321.1 cyclic nucleotide-binding domain-containing protein [Cyanobacteria bacterium CAN_BIN43]